MKTQRIIRKTFVAASFIIAEDRKPHKYLSTEEQKNKWWYQHVMEYYPEVNRNTLLIHSNTLLSERVSNCDFTSLGKAKLRRQKAERWLPGIRGEGGTTKRHKGLFPRTDTFYFLNIESGGCMTIYCILSKNSLSCTLRMGEFWWALGVAVETA